LPNGHLFPFEYDAGLKHRMLNGLDDIGMTLQHADKIRAYETRRRQEAPWLFIET
ncbi:MAG: 3-isopropylmalate dehydratase small subunit, partial [Gammaproteobacteria bacterium]